MRPLSELFFDLFVDLDISFKDFDLRLHFVVFGKELFRLFWLIFQFSSQLMILENSQSSGCLQLFIIKCK